VQETEPVAAETDGGAVLLSVPAGANFGYNRVATEIWNMLGEPCRVDQIFDLLAKRHGVDVQTLARDVTPFLQSLEHRLLRVIDRGEAR
ncbi:MAG: PqqD family protein, partial [Pseudomonadota bacterium]